MTRRVWTKPKPVRAPIYHAMRRGRKAVVLRLRGLTSARQRFKQRLHEKLDRMMDRVRISGVLRLDLEIEVALALAVEDFVLEGRTR